MIVYCQNIYTNKIIWWIIYEILLITQILLEVNEMHVKIQSMAYFPIKHQN